MKLDKGSYLCFCFSFFVNTSDYIDCTKETHAIFKKISPLENKVVREEELLLGEDSNQEIFIINMLKKYSQEKMQKSMPFEHRFTFPVVNGVEPFVKVILEPPVKLMENCIDTTKKRFQDNFIKGLSTEDKDKIEELIKYLTNEFHRIREEKPESEDNGHVFLTIRWMISQRILYGMDAFNFNLFNEIIKLLNFFSKKTKERVRGHVCSKFALNKNDYYIKGGIELPQKIPITKEIIENVGYPEIWGFDLKFSNSPIGIENINLEIEEQNIVISPKINYITNIDENLLKDIFTLTLEVTDLFVGEKHE